jgi:hypothetical protein
MTFFEDELREIFYASPVIQDARFVGRACIGRLGDTTNVKLEFVTMGTYQHYEGIKATIFNRNEGVIDSNVFRFIDMLGLKPGRSMQHGNKVSPHVWVYNDKTEWYSYQPNATDYATIAASVNRYLEVFLEPTHLSHEAEKTASERSDGLTSVKAAIERDKEKPKKPRNTRAKSTKKDEQNI